MKHADHEEVYTLAQQERDYEIAWANLDSLPYPVYDGSGCRYVQLDREDTFGLIDYDGTYRLGLYDYTSEDDFGYTPLETSDFESFARFLYVLTGKEMK